MKAHAVESRQNIASHCSKLRNFCTQLAAWMSQNEFFWLCYFTYIFPFLNWLYHLVARCDWSCTHQGSCRSWLSSCWSREISFFMMLSYFFLLPSSVIFWRNASLSWISFSTETQYRGPVVNVPRSLDRHCGTPVDPDNCGHCQSMLGFFLWDMMENELLCLFSLSKCHLWGFYTF